MIVNHWIYWKVPITTTVISIMIIRLFAFVSFAWSLLPLPCVYYTNHHLLSVLVPYKCWYFSLGGGIIGVHFYFGKCWVPPLLLVHASSSLSLLCSYKGEKGEESRSQWSVATVQYNQRLSLDVGFVHIVVLYVFVVLLVFWAVVVYNIRTANLPPYFPAPQPLATSLLLLYHGQILGAILSYCSCILGCLLACIVSSQCSGFHTTMLLASLIRIPLIMLALDVVCNYLS